MCMLLHDLMGIVSFLTSEEHPRNVSNDATAKWVGANLSRLHRTDDSRLCMSAPCQSTVWGQKASIKE